MDSGTIVIANPDSLTQIINRINHCHREPIEFYPTHQLKLRYNNGEEKMILSNDSAMKFEGITYRLEESISTIIEN